MHVTRIIDISIFCPYFSRNSSHKTWSGLKCNEYRLPKRTGSGRFMRFVRFGVGMLPALQGEVAVGVSMGVHGSTSRRSSRDDGTETGWEM